MTETVVEHDFDGLSTFETLEELIGTDAARRLCNLYGGRQVYIPRDPLAAHWLLEAVGAEATETLCKYLAVGKTGTRLLMPKGSGNRGVQFHADIMRMSDEGFSTGEIATALNLHERTIYRERAKGRKARAKRLGGRIRRMLGDGFTEAEIAEKIGLPLHSTKAVIDTLNGKGGA